MSVGSPQGDEAFAERRPRCWPATGPGAACSVAAGTPESVRAVSSRLSSADEGEEGVDLGGEQRGLLPRREVAAALGLAPVADVRESPLRPAPRGPLELVREDAAAGGGVDEVARLERALEPAGDV